MINLNIEPANFCNAQCYYCTLGTKRFSHGNKKSFLPLRLHDAVFSQLDSFIHDARCCPALDKNVYVRYCGVGEPTLHPDFIRMVDTSLHSTHVTQLAILSNGITWKRALSDSLMRIIMTHTPRPIEIIFSVDSVQPFTQYAIKKTRNTQTTTQQLRYLLAQKSKFRLAHLHPVIQAIVLDENVNEIDDFCSFWADVFCSYGFSWKIVDNPVYPVHFSDTDCFIWLKVRDTDSAQQAKCVELQRTAITRLTPPRNVYYANMRENEPRESRMSSVPAAACFSHVCSILWYGINIAANGDVSPCCVDVEYSLKLGNIGSQSLCDMYRAAYMQQLRKAHIDNQLFAYPLCKNCNILYKGPAVSDTEVAGYLRALKNTD